MCAFVTEDQSLFFSKVPLNSTASTRIKIRNIGKLGTDVYAEIGGYDYKVTPTKQYIDSYAEDFFKITFTPTLLEVSKIIFFTN